MPNKRKRSDFWLQTYSSQQYDFKYNYIEDVNILDIAQGLSQQVRFVGQLHRPLSLAQHSLMVSASLEKDGQPKSVCLQGLMHDAHEAYIGDISRPWKMYLLHEYGIDMERIVQPIKYAIGKKYDIELIDLPDVVHKYDDAVLRTEAESLFERIVDNWTKHIKHKLQSNVKTILGCVEAKELFIETFNRLGGKS